MRLYSSELTVDINGKGVLDIDVVKGCTFGIAAHGEKGCYQACYAASIAKFRGIDFSQAVTRKVTSRAQAKKIEKAVKASPLGFFRVGTMGDPCHDWDETTETVKWLAPYARPIIITKHWAKASDEHLNELSKAGAIINTSISALDSEKQLAHRERQIKRFAEMGGQSVARIVSCDFNKESEEGAKMAAIQERLFKHEFIIDNPLRIPANHVLVQSGAVKVRKVVDLIAVRTISIPEESKTYVGHCDGCTELCGMGIEGVKNVRAEYIQKEMFTN